MSRGHAAAALPVTQGAKVAVTIAPGGKSVLYDVRGCACGGDSFTYTVTDGHGATDVATFFVTVARPGQNGLSSYPITDVPTLSLVSNSTLGSTVPARLSWCGVTRSGYSVRSYTVAQSANGGASYGTILSGTTAASSVRNFSAAPPTAGGRGRPTRPAVPVPTDTRRLPGFFATRRRQVAIVGPRSATPGSFRVYVDGGLVATISERATSATYRRVLYVRTLTSGVGVTHRIEIRVVGNGRIDLDAILTLG